MSGEQGWRTEVDAFDYLQGQKKKAEVADRRPVIRRAADLVGPGIGASAVRLDDFNNTLATFNGFFSAVDGAGNAPLPVGKFIGTVSVDSEFGGLQEFTDMTTGIAYRRRFHRYPGDPDLILWEDWVDVGGGGGGGGSTQVADFNLATVAGFYSALAGASNAPKTGNFVGYVAADPSAGGLQRFTDLSNQQEWTRKFTISGSTVSWDAWREGSYLGPQPFFRAWRNNSALSLTTGWNKMQFNALDPGVAGSGTWDLTNNRFTVSRAGLFFINGSVRWTGNATGLRGVGVAIGGTTIYLAGYAEASALGMTVPFSGHLDLEVGQQIEMHVYQNTGASLNILADASRSTFFEIVYVGPTG